MACTMAERYLSSSTSCTFHHRPKEGAGIAKVLLKLTMTLGVTLWSNQITALGTMGTT